MGCEIHAYVDYNKNGQDFVTSFGEFNIERDPLLFAILTGVEEFPHDKIEPIVSQKGLPEKLSSTTASGATLYIIDNGEEYNGDEEKCCSRSDATEWEESIPMGCDYYLDKEKKRICHPDWHSHSWLTIDELSRSLKRYSAIARSRGRDNCTAPTDIKAILAAMRLLKKNGFEPTFVFWFEN